MHSQEYVNTDNNESSGMDGVHCTTCTINHVNINSLKSLFSSPMSSCAGAGAFWSLPQLLWSEASGGGAGSTLGCARCTGAMQRRYIV